MPFQIIRHDITKVKADAIVNTANPKPIVGRGTDSAIYHAAGEAELIAERMKIGIIERGDAKATPAFKLDAKYIIHTVGPYWIDGKSGELDVLRHCYANSLNLANELGCHSIAFPLISSGTYGFPKDQALSIAMSEISGFLLREDSDMEITLVVFDQKAFRLSKNLFMEVASYIDDEEVRRAHMQDYHMNIPQNERYYRRRGGNESAVYGRDDSWEWSSVLRPEEKAEDFQEVAGNAAGKTPGAESDKAAGKTPGAESNKAAGKVSGGAPAKGAPKPFFPTSKFIFRDRLLKFMQEKGIEDSKTVYFGANVSKGAFSKIMCGDTKTPKKDAVMGFCISMKLNQEESEDLMASAGWAFNPYDKRDQLILDLIVARKNIFDVNSALFAANLDSLGHFE